MLDNAHIFKKLRNAPDSLFKDITPPPLETASHGAILEPDSVLTDQPGIISEADALQGVSGAEIGAFDSPGTVKPGITAETTGSGTPQTLGGLLTAKTAIGIMDAVIPAAAVILLQYIFDLKLQKKELQLTESERAILTPVLQNYLNSVPVAFDSPLAALLITVGAIYGSKFAEKGFNQYFDKKDAERAKADIVQAIAKEQATVVTKPATVVTMPDKKQPARTDPAASSKMTEYGYTEQQLKDARKASGFSNYTNKQAAAWLDKQKEQAV